MFSPKTVQNPSSSALPWPFKLCILVLVLQFFPVNSHAQVDDYLHMHSEQGSLYNARATGMGNAYSTIGYDYTAVRFNPSTLAVADSLSFLFGINYNVYPNTAEYRKTNSLMTTTNTAFTQFGMTVPLSSESRRTVAALGFAESKDLSRNLRFSGYNSTTSTLINDLTNFGSAVVADLGLNYPLYDSSGAILRTETILGSDLQQDGNVDETGSVLTLSGGIATETAHNVFFGASVNYNIGTWKSNREFVETDLNNVYDAGTSTVPGNPATSDFQSFYYHESRDVLMRGFEVRLGVLYKFFDFISIGGAYKIALPHTISETRSIEGTSRFASGLRAVTEPYQNNTYTVIPAPEMTAGAAVNLWILTVTAEATFIDYTQITYKDGPSKLETSLYNKKAAEVYARVLNLNGGAEFRIPFTNLSTRAGFMYRPTAYKSDTRDYDRKYLSAGIGYVSEGWLSFDLAYGYGWWNEIYRGNGETFAGVIQQIQVHDLISTIRLTLP